MLDSIEFFLKFGEKQHIDEFVKGNLFCSNAESFWNIEKKQKTKGQGDTLEAGSKLIAKKLTAHSLDSNYTTKIDGNLNITIHYEQVKLVPVFCLSMVKDEDCFINENGKKIISFSEKKQKTIMEHFPKADTVAIISNPKQFIEDINNSIGHKVICEEIHYFHIDKGLPVHGNYNNSVDMEYFYYLTQDSPPVIEKGKTTYSFHSDYAYRALLCKDVFFEDENEFRIILPEEHITKGKTYPVQLNETIEVASLDSFFK